jgi:hypothetical protein
MGTGRSESRVRMEAGARGGPRATGKGNAIEALPSPKENPKPFHEDGGV